jgi:glycine C-acetyltransferase
MKKLTDLTKENRIDEFVQRYYQLSNRVKDGSLNFEERMAEASRIIDGSIESGIYFYRRALQSSKPKSKVIDDRIEKNIDIVNLSSNDYLNFTQNPRVIQASVETTEEYGIGTGSVPMLSGTLEIHRTLEDRLASFLGYQNCILYNSGYSTNYGVFSSILRPGDVAILDTYVHASVIDGCQNARKLFFLHNDVESLERALIKSQNHKNVLVIIDGVYSMDGDIAKLREIKDLVNSYNAYLAIDDAHGIGVLGTKGKGTQNEYDMDGAADLITGSFGKALAGVGGFVCGKKEWMNYLELMSRPFLFSSSIPPGVVGALIKQIDILEAGEAPIQRLWENTKYFRRLLLNEGYDLGSSETPIVPVILKDEVKVIQICRRLQEKGVFVNPIIYPVVSKNKSRLRISLTSGLSRSDLDFCFEMLKQSELETTS